ncbi:ABC transporter ATP-binding protein [Pseudoxanthomonas kalamensis DSM 18571]|uniref:ABC transporter permease n=1 Tax=Pseudoxanthomonas kalamensis TaxID=289483 RepID=UPI001390EE14|nr:ABC transporter permease [Pseudoxanthomonas kalamensis]KAF1712592.1 ABC transporter ATP-binding protein [Pseudoxanthomonas kalamensis DSM 18571]
MFGYYFSLALRSFRRNKVLTVLMVLTIALGIGASMTTLTVFHVLSGDPIPQKSGKLFYPQIEPRTMGRNGKPEPEPSDQMTRFDAEELLRQKKADYQAVMTGGSLTAQPENSGIQPFRVQARYTSADFFPMFEPPMLAGRSWTAKEDEARALVVVISRKLAEKLFGDGNAVGRELRTLRSTFQIIGVMDEWKLSPRFYDLTHNRFGGNEMVFLPFSTSRELRLGTRGSMNCWGDSRQDEEGSTGINAPCAWLQYWVQLDTPQKVADYRKYLVDYSEQQRRAGRFTQPANTRLHSVMEWLDYKKIVPNDVRLQMWLAFGFLLVCLVNTVGLLLAKFLRRSGEIGVRRALGASRLEIFKQCLVEVGCIGIVGAVLGLGFAWLGLWLVRQQPDDYAKLAQLDAQMLLVTFVLSLLASLLAGVLPAWRAMQIAPAVQLKTQ